MNNRNKIRFLLAFLVVLTGLPGLEVWREVKAQHTEDETGGIWTFRRHHMPSPPSHSWTFDSKDLVFGLEGYESKTLLIFAKKFYTVHTNIFVVAGALVVIPALYAVVFSWIIILRRRMKAPSPGPGSAERPVH